MVKESRKIHRHKQTVIALMTVLFLFLLTIDGLIIYNQRNVLLTQAHKQVQNELELLGMLVTEALIKGDYATVEVFLNSWGNQRKDLIEATIKLDNGFELARYSHTIPDVVQEKYQREISYAKDRKIYITLLEDMSVIHQLLWSLSAKLVLATLLLVILLGASIWKLLKLLAIKPLEQEISEHKKTEKKLREYAAELKSINSELETFSYSVSHDLRTPLRAIDGYSQILQEDYIQALDNTAKDYLGRIRQGAQHMSTLIDKLLQLSRITRRDVEAHTVDISAVANMLIAKYRELDADRDVDVVIDPDLIAYGDEILLTQMLDNLLGNAWKYTAKTDKAKIEVRQSVIDGKLTFFVKDNGVGFDKQYIGKLFGVFQRLHADSEFEGTGVGLAIVKRIIMRHEGTVWAESEENKGCTLFFTLPDRVISGNAEGNIKEDSICHTDLIPS